MLLVQVLVLIFTGALWWIARRDLAARVPPPAPPAADTAELEQLCATLETLATSLARRLEAVERGAAARQPVPQPEAVPPQRRSEPAPAEPLPAMPSPAEPAFLEPRHAATPDPRYAPVYALLDAGVVDPVEIARQTGLGRGEVDLILSLRGRRAL